MSMFETLVDAAREAAGKTRLAFKMRHPAKLAVELASDMAFKFNVFGNGRGFPIDMRAFAAGFRGLVTLERRTFLPAASGAYLLRMHGGHQGGGSVEFDASDEEQVRRVRFARALGQYLWLSLKHPDLQLAVVDHDGSYLNGTNNPPLIDEEFVTAFTSCLLMPDFEVARLRAERKTPSEIVAHFGVPPEFGFAVLGESVPVAPVNTLARGYSHLAEAWHAESTFKAAGVDFVDEISLDTYDADGESNGSELFIRWSEGRTQSGSLVAHLQVTEDSWRTLAQFGDVLKEMSKLDGTAPQPANLIAMLEKLGFQDMTPRERRTRIPVDR